MATTYPRSPLMPAPQHVVRAGLTLGKALGQAIEDRLDLLPAAGRGFGAKEGDRVMVRPQALARTGVAILQGHDFIAQPGMTWPRNAVASSINVPPVQMGDLDMSMPVRSR